MQKKKLIAVSALLVLMASTLSGCATRCSSCCWAASPAAFTVAQIDARG